MRRPGSLLAGSGKAIAVLSGVGVVCAGLIVYSALQPRGASAVAQTGASTTWSLKTVLSNPSSTAAAEAEAEDAKPGTTEYVKPRPVPAWTAARMNSISAPWEKKAANVHPKVVYLTFDDGPYPRWTPQILSLLAQYDARATFFQLGQVRREFPELAAQVEAYGHTIGNHTYDHRAMTALSDSKLRWEIENGAPSKCLRPPYGDTNHRVGGVVRSEGYRTVLWDVDTLDWKKPGSNAIERTVLNNVKPGSIVLMHDGGGERSQTVSALSRILPALSAQGYQFHALRC